MDFETLINKREAVRSFSNQTVEKDKIMKILEAGRLAPTAKNNQPEFIYVIESEEGIKKVDEVTPCRYNASTVLLVCSNKNIAFYMENYSSYEMDASIIATHMMLEATNLGIDTVWVRMFDADKVKEVFNLDEGLEPVLFMPLGYRTAEYPGSINHHNRKDLSEITKFI